MSCLKIISCFLDQMNKCIDGISNNIRFTDDYKKKKHSSYVDFLCHLPNIKARPY